MAELNDPLAAAPAPAPVSDNTFSFTLPESAGSLVVSIDVAQVPGPTRLALLHAGIKGLISGRINVAIVRYNKDNAPFAALAAHDAAVAANIADPITNQPPTTDRAALVAAIGERKAPDTVNVSAKVSEAIADLIAGKTGTRKGEGAGRARVTKDPVDAAVTGVVVREVFAKNKALNSKYTYPMAVKEIGDAGGGTAFLKARIATLVAGGASEADLNKMLETKYLAPARAMTGTDALKGKAGELPNIL